MLYGSKAGDDEAKDSFPDNDESSSVKSAERRSRRCNSRGESLNDVDWVSSCEDTEDTTAALLLISGPSSILSPACRSTSGFLPLRIPSTVKEDFDEGPVREHRFDRRMEVDSETFVM